MSNRDKFISLVKENIHRNGVSFLLDWLEHETDFFISPASTKYHGACEGGLVAHSLEVYNQFCKIAPVFSYDMSNKLMTESATIVTLFHDICKVDNYTKTFKNVKNPETGKWELEEGYIYNQNGNLFGAHGASSLFYINQHMKLNFVESTAIYHHMGAWDASKYDNVASVYEWNKLAWLLHIADEASTYLEGK